MTEVTELVDKWFEAVYTHTHAQQVQDLMVSINIRRETEVIKMNQMELLDQKNQK